MSDQRNGSILKPAFRDADHFQPQDTNGRGCATCHIPWDAWSINPGTIQRLFDETGGTHPVFNPLAANTNNPVDLTTVEGREAGYSMLLSRGVFRRCGVLRAEPREWDLVADPNSRPSGPPWTIPEAIGNRNGPKWAADCGPRAAIRCYRFTQEFFGGTGNPGEWVGALVLRVPIVR